MTRTEEPTPVVSPADVAHLVDEVRELRDGHAETRQRVDQLDPRATALEGEREEAAP